MISLISWLIYGLIVGSVAKWIYEIDLSFWRTVGLGVVGSYVGGGLSSALNGDFAFHSSGIALGIIGAVVTVFLYKKYEESQKA